MFRNVPAVVIQPQYSRDDSAVEAMMMADTHQPKRERRLRHTSPSPTRSRFLRIVRRNEHVTGNGERSQSEVKRCHSYHDLEQAASAVGIPGPHGSSIDEHRAGGSGIDLATMSTAAAVSSSTASGPVGGVREEATHHLTVEEPRSRKSSGGSHNILFSLGIRFGGGKKKKDKKSAGDLPSPVTPEPTVDGDADVTLYR